MPEIIKITHTNRSICTKTFRLWSRIELSSGDERGKVSWQVLMGRMMGGWVIRKVRRYHYGKNSFFRVLKYFDVSSQAIISSRSLSNVVKF